MSEGSYEKDNRPLTPKNVALATRRRKKPVGAVILLVFLIIDAAKLHLLHHALGKDSGVYAAVLFLSGITWGVYRLVKWVEQ